jgi:hypothetical protein
MDSRHTNETTKLRGETDAFVLKASEDSSKVGHGWEVYINLIATSAAGWTQRAMGSPFER